MKYFLYSYFISVFTFFVFCLFSFLFSTTFVVDNYGKVKESFGISTSENSNHENVSNKDETSSFETNKGIESELGTIINQLDDILTNGSKTTVDQFVYSDSPYTVYMNDYLNNDQELIAETKVEKKSIEKFRLLDGDKDADLYSYLKNYYESEEVAFPYTDIAIGQIKERITYTNDDQSEMIVTTIYVFAKQDSNWKIFDSLPIVD